MACRLLGGVPDRETMTPGRRQPTLAASFLIFGASFFILDVAVVVHGGSLLATVGIAIMTLSGIPAAVTFLDVQRTKLWAGAMCATFGTGLSGASLGMFQMVDAWILGVLLAAAFGSSFWIAGFVFVWRWKKVQMTSDHRGGELP